MNTTYESILNFLCSKITKVSTLVGSFTYNILAACAFKFLDLEGKIYALKENMSIDTADSEGIDILASNNGITRKSATVGVAKGEFDVEIPTSSKFQVNEVVWVSGDLINKEGHYFYKMTSEQTGSDVNKAIGKAKAITYIENLTYAYIVEMITLAEDKESNESIISRYKESFTSKSFAGNKASYKEYLISLDGIGGARIVATWDGDGTTKCIVQSSDYSVVSADKIAEIQNIVDPDKTGTGEGIAPIGAKVTIESVVNKDISISARFTFISGTFDDWKVIIENLIKEYFLEKNKEWNKDGTIIIRVAEIIAKIITNENISDVSDLKINGSSENLILENNEIANLKEVLNET